MASVNPVDPEIGEGFAPFSISSNTGPDTIHLSPFQSNKNNKGLGPPRARSSSVPPPEASIEGGFAMDPISRAGHVDSTPPGTKTHGLLSAAMKNLGRPPRASLDTRSSSILPPEASIQGGIAIDLISRAGHIDSTPPGTKTHGLLSAAMKKIAKIFKL